MDQDSVSTRTAMETQQVRKLRGRYLLTQGHPKRLVITIPGGSSQTRGLTRSFPWLKSPPWLSNTSRIKLVFLCLSLRWVSTAALESVKSKFRARSVLKSLDLGQMTLPIRALVSCLLKADHNRKMAYFISPMGSIWFHAWSVV